MGQIVKPYTFSNGEVIDAPKFNSNYDTIYNEFNGLIDTNNIKAGYFLIEKVATLPAAGTAGRLVFLTTDNALYKDNGSAWVKVTSLDDDLIAKSYPTEPPGTIGQIIYDSTKNTTKFYNGTKWLPMGGAVLKRLTLTNQAFSAGVVTNISFAGAFQFGKILKIRVEKNPTGQETGYIYIRFYADAALINEISQQYSIDLATADIAGEYVCHVPLGEGIPYALDGTTLYAKVKTQNSIALDLQITIEESTE